MSRYGNANPGAAVSTVIVEAAAPDILQTDLTAAIAGLPAQSVILDMTLAGAGDGHQFTITVEYAAPAAVAAGGLTAAQVRCYMASQRDAIATARAAVQAPNAQMVDSQVAGASAGLRFMGLLVFGVLAPSGDAAGVLREMVFRPGGAAAPGIFPDWADLVAAATAQGAYPVRIVLDGTQVGNNWEIPIGAWALPPGSEMHGLRDAVANESGEILGAITGVTLLSNIQIVQTGPGTPFTLTEGSMTFENAILNGSPDAPLFELPEGATVQFISRNTNLVGTVDVGCIRVAQGATLELFLLEQSHAFEESLNILGVPELGTHSIYLDTSATLADQATFSTNAPTTRFFTDLQVEHFRNDGPIGTTDVTWLVDSNGVGASGFLTTWVPPTNGRVRAVCLRKLGGDPATEVVEFIRGGSPAASVDVSANLDSYVAFAADADTKFDLEQSLEFACSGLDAAAEYSLDVAIWYQTAGYRGWGPIGP